MKPHTNVQPYEVTQPPERRDTTFRAVMIESMLVLLLLALFEYWLSDLQRWAQSIGPNARNWLDAVAWAPFYYLQVRFIMWASPKD